jgi:hypothetical protein
MPSPTAANRRTGGTRHSVAALGCKGPPPWPARPGRAEAAAGQPVVTGRHPRRRRPRCKWRAGPGCRGRGRSGSWSSGRRGRRLLGHPAAGPRHPTAVMNACRSVCGPTGLVIPARPATRRTIRAAPCRFSRRPSAARKTGPSLRSPTARSSARAVRGASGMVATLPPLRVMIKVRCPRSTPSASMLVPVTSETRSPLRASREISACSAGTPRPAATSSAPSSLQSSPVACDS